MTIGRKLGVLAGAMALAGLAMGASLTAQASTLQCVAHESCGGADLALLTHGQLSLAALGISTVNGGFGYNNEHVGVNASGLSDGSEDFTVFQDETQTAGHGGYFGFGDYTVMFTPGGHLPFANSAPGTIESAASVGNGASVAYCISVMDTYPVVGGHVVQRWALVLRNCFAWPGTTFKIGTHDNPTTVINEESEGTVHNPNVYQEWSPTETGDGFLQFQDLALNTAHFRHGFGGHSFVMDDRGNGGAGTWGVAYPDHDGINQKFTIIGCTNPVTVFNSRYFNCPS